MSAAPTTDRLLTPEELAVRWRVVRKKPAAAIYRMVRDGLIPPGVVVKLGSRYRFRLEGIEAFERDGGKGLGSK